MKNKLAPKNISEKHYEIIINRNKIKIIGFTEKSSFDTITGKKINTLELKTKMKGQIFPSSEEKAIIIIEKIKIEFVGIKYGAVWSGTGLLETHIYKILDKKVYE